MKHPIKIGTKTNIGVIESYKYIRFGIGKYRYYVQGSDKSFGQEEITKIL